LQQDVSADVMADRRKEAHMQVRASALRQLLLVIVVGGTVCCAAVVRAKEAARQEGNAQGQGARLADRVDLQAAVQQVSELILDLATDQQKARVQEILDKTQEAIKALRDDLEAKPDQRRAIAQKLMQTVQDMRTSLNEMLSPEQREKLNEIMQAARSQVGLQLLRLERKLAKLILTDEQKLKMDELKSEVREQMQAIRQEVAADRQGAAQKVRELTQSLRRRLAEILTADQQKELRELMRPAGGEGKPEPQGETARK